MKLAFIYDVPYIISGGSVCLYDYAYFNQALLNNESIILADKNIHPLVYEKFRKELDIILYDNLEHLETLCHDLHVDKCYIIGDGKDDTKYIKNVDNLYHAVFHCNPSPKYDRYALVSDWLSQTNNNFPYVVPHMINLPDHHDNFRKEFDIPEDHAVFGRYGSIHTFDIEWVPNAIIRALESRKDLWFVFANTPQFYKHDRIIYMDPIINQYTKVKFINSVDAMLHNRARGETYGLSCGEFNIKNKPIYTYWSSAERAHLEILGDKAVCYNSEDELFNLFSSFDISYRNRDWIGYRQDKFGPEAVMKQFDKIFLQ